MKQYSNISWGSRSHVSVSEPHTPPTGPHVSSVGGKRVGDRVEQLVADPGNPPRSRSGRSRSRARGGRGRELGAHRGPVSARCRYKYKNRFLVGGKVVYMCNTN